MITIIAEKPSVARDIARVVGAKETKEGFLTGNNYNVTYAFGHLVGLAEPTEYGYSEKWLKAELPLLPEVFKLIPNKDAKKQLKVIKDLFKNSESIIVATDAGREGELIFRWIYEYLNVAKPFKRLWISDMTDKSILQGMANLLDGKTKDNLYNAAKARAESDWIIGLNSTRLLTINNGTLLSIGRVQTPTLRLIVDRFIDNKNFTVTDYWKPFIEVDNNQVDQKIKLSCDKEFLDENQIKKFVIDLQTIRMCNIKREDKKEKEKSPKLYSLTSLQKHANSKLNFTADQTLKVLQSLYEKHKIVTYPRTDSEFLTENQIEEVTTTLKSHTIYFQESNINYTQIDKNAAFNSAKVTDHHAIIPTHILPSPAVLQKLSSDELNLYNLVIVRFFQRFSPDCEKDKTFLTTIVNNTEFKYTHTTETFKGWKIYSKDKLEDNSEESDQVYDYPIKIESGQEKQILNYAYSKHQTKPKPIHNEASLLSAMETAGKEIENEDLKDQMKGKGLGTPATRSGIIELLINRKFIERKGKQLIPTQTGTDLINNVRNHKISIPEWTAEQEYELYKVETGETTYDSYISSVKEITKSVLVELDEVKVTTTPFTRENLGICPKCKQGNILEGKIGYGCSRYKEGCNFVVWKEIAKKSISVAAVKKLLKNNESDLIKGFTSAKGKFDARLTINENFEVKFKFENKFKK
ncbi:type IA DNA topoisomerase [Chryseobacterium sp. 5_R23647]|uniref:type IA DNA topoisomerase n=1 Tax=Chryseobacterium sp. 5_R23647 TaxID=2258964 RepID=UPI000E28786A|nr:type IA DNA topoisomerase [Chryseobacterium sp. 5_R23647]REC40576.1 type IA DNA topoisomerase [Chryseobacterium sp. 5_R23647]